MALDGELILEFGADVAREDVILTISRMALCDGGGMSMPMVLCVNKNEYGVSYNCFGEEVFFLIECSLVPLSLPISYIPVSQGNTQLVDIVEHLIINGDRKEFLMIAKPESLPAILRGLEFKCMVQKASVGGGKSRFFPNAIHHILQNLEVIHLQSLYHILCIRAVWDLRSSAYGRTRHHHRD